LYQTKPTNQRSIDISAFEDWIVSLPRTTDVASWRCGGLDIWPLFKTVVVGLGVNAHIQQPKLGLKTGSLGWQAGVIADYFVVSGIGHVLSGRRAPVTPEGGLSGHVLYFASGGHSRDLDGLFVTPSLDVPAALLEQAGKRSVFWHENLSENDPQLSRTLFGPAFGLANLLTDARRRSMRFGTYHALGALPGFSDACEIAARHLMLSARFLCLWLARQVNLALSVADAFGKVFDEAGFPEMLIILNSCVWSTTGLVAAAKRRGIPVIEAHHGAETRSAVTAPGQLPHFSTFSTAPDALISWECEQRGDARVFAAGPLGLQLVPVLLACEPARSSFPGRLRDLTQQQRQLLAERIGPTRYAGEVLVTLQPGSAQSWILEVLAALPSNVFVWIRLHTMESERVLSIPPDLGSRVETRLSSSTFLPLLLERVDVHITSFSGVTLEAAAMGVPTIASDPYAADLYASRMPADALAIEQTPEAIARRVATYLVARPPERRNHLPDLTNLVDFIEIAGRTVRNEHLARDVA
jgi:hypothetical protein